MFKTCLFIIFKHKLIKQSLCYVTNIILHFCIVLYYLQNYSPPSVNSVLFHFSIFFYLQLQTIPYLHYCLILLN